MNYYNEFDPKTAAWLRELIKAGLIPQGEVDERSITDVQSGDLAGFTQCHFFAGIGGWPYALKLAGWPEEREAWTGSCPCQPFSDAGKQLGEADERHLWPHFFRLIRQRKPAIVFGEQVASKAALQWLDGVFADLEGETYSCAAADIYAASLGAPHIRQRLFWVADAQHNAGRTDQPRRGSEGRAADGRDCEVVRVADSGRGQREQCLRPQGDRLQRPADCGVVGWMGEPILPGSEGRAGNGDKGHQPGRDNPDQARPITEAGDSGGVDNAAGVRCQGPNGASEQEQGSGQGRIGFWSDAIWHACRDGKARRISPKPGIQSLVNGLSVGMDDLRNESISEIEKEVNLYAKTNQTEPGKALHDLWCSLVSQAMGRAGGGGGTLEDLTAFTKRRFCSLACANSRLRGGLSRKAFHNHARKQRKLYCEACGFRPSVKMKLHVHHIDEDWTNNSPENLQTLCNNCHKFWHAIHDRSGIKPCQPMPQLISL